MSNDNLNMKMAMDVKQMMERVPAMLDFVAYQAKLTRKKYLSLVESGFTEAQALELCKS